MVYHLLGLLNLLSSDLWKNLDRVGVHGDSRLLLDRWASVEAVWGSHWNSLDCLLPAGAWSGVARLRLGHAIESFTVQCRLKLL